MTLLAIESATDMVGVALMTDGGAVSERVHVGGRVHAELLVPSIEEVCAIAGHTVSDITTIAVDVGPGLFTGLRVGVATAKALAQALGIGVVGISSLDTLAAATDAEARSGSDGPVGTVAAVVDARRSEVFAAVFRFARAPGDATAPPDPGAVRDDREEPLSPEGLVDWLVEVAGSDGPVMVVGDGAVRYRHLLSVHPGLDLRWAEELAAPPPLALVRLAHRRLEDGELPVDAGLLVPDYRRPADARINWEQRAPRSTAGPGSAPA